MKTREEAKKWIKSHWGGLVDNKQLVIVLGKYWKKYPYKKNGKKTP